VRARAAELRGSLLEIVNTLSDAPHLLQWDSVLKKFSTVNLQVEGSKSNSQPASAHGLCIH